jgi:hypothetical protein
LVPLMVWSHPGHPGHPTSRSMVFGGIKHHSGRKNLHLAVKTKNIYPLVI